MAEALWRAQHGTAYACSSTPASRTRTNTNPNGTEANAAGRSVRACVARESKRERERMYGWARDAPDEWAGHGRVREWKALVWGWRDL